MNQNRKTLLASCLAALLLCAALAGCGRSTEQHFDAGAVSDVVAPDDSAELAEQADNAAPGEVLRVLESGSSVYGYQKQWAERSSLMTENEENLYDLAAESVYTIETECNSSGYYNMGRITMWDTELTEAEIKLAITAFKNDHPEVFWIASVYGRAYQDGNTIVQLYSYVPPSECNEMIRVLAAAVGQVVQTVGENQSEFNRELISFQAVADGCVYDTATAELEGERNWESFTAYGALVSGSAVCEGYSRAMQLLLSNLGMECRLICGVAQGSSHMWNLVKLEEDWYHLDATWNDQQDVVLYDYFNLTDEMIGEDHTVSPQLTAMTAEEISAYLETGDTYNLSLPECIADKENYLQNCAIPIDSFSEAEDRRVIESFQAAAKNQSPAVYLYISPDIDFDLAVSRILKGSGPKLFTYIDGSNQLYGIPQIDREHARYILNETARSITVILRYQ